MDNNDDKYSNAEFDGYFVYMIFKSQNKNRKLSQTLRSFMLQILNGGRDLTES